MIAKVKQNFTLLISSVLTDGEFAKLSKPRKFFIAHTCTACLALRAKHKCTVPSTRVYEVRGNPSPCHNSYTFSRKSQRFIFLNRQSFAV